MFHNTNEFSNGKVGCEKWKNNYFLCKVNIKDPNFFLDGYICNDNKNIYIFIENINDKWKRNVYCAFLIKKSLYMLDKAKIQNSFSKLERTHFVVSKIKNFFLQSQCTDRRDPHSPLFVFVSLLRNPLPLLRNERIFWMNPLFKKIKEAYRHKEKIQRRDRRSSW